MARAQQSKGARYTTHRVRRYEKRRLARLRRRAEKRDPEAAPKTRRGFMRGWAD